ncbi:MAG: uroporphyrinogen decarboxylase family protein [Candidatus Omnitrophota bacterium]
MNSKERVCACIGRKDIDAVPLGFYLVDCDTISRVLGRPTFVKNNAATQIAFWEGRRDEVVETMKRDIVEFYRKIDLCDLITWKEACTVPPKNYTPQPPKKISDECWEDKEGRIFKLSKISNEIVCVQDPTASEKRWTPEDFKDQPPDNPPDLTSLEVYDYLVEQLGKERYIAGMSAGVSPMVYLGGQENGLVAYLNNPDLVRAAIRYTAESQNLADKYYLRPGISGVFIEFDFCDTQGPLISPALWREFCYPGLKNRIDNIKKVFGLNTQILFHSCGNTRKLLDQFADAGVQVYQSIQNISAMRVGDLKREFGNKLVFWGGIPVEELISGTPETVRKSVRRTMEECAPGGGFILGPSHSIAYGTKYDNFMAMLDEFNNLRFNF